MEEIVGAEKTEGRDSPVNKDSWRSKARGQKEMFKLPSFQMTVVPSGISSHRVLLYGKFEGQFYYLLPSPTNRERERE